MPRRRNQRHRHPPRCSRSRLQRRASNQRVRSRSPQDRSRRTAASAERPRPRGTPSGTSRRSNRSPERRRTSTRTSNSSTSRVSAFKFSSFGDTEELGIKEEPYVLGTIKPAKVTWQEDPRFQDSSSEGDDEPEVSEIGKDQEMFLSLPRTESARVFFFSQDDERLGEGPKLFCRLVELKEEKEGWEDRRRSLLEVSM
ncbi:nucleolar protein 8-like [Motacilla alba alba]|uniref:nucleolar protein 8-like n=1 Tax=Motacilla alba alba TaxID=1094192 RepID=UPI0018D50C11|nr:nucleolar protein 8-like [Motacilla alba alba]